MGTPLSVLGLTSLSCAGLTPLSCAGLTSLSPYITLLLTSLSRWSSHHSAPYTITMAITFNTAILKTTTGIFKIVEIVLVYIVLFILRFGLSYGYGGVDNMFLAQGTTVGYAIIVPSILFTYLLGANLSILELFINFLGGILFVAIGSVAMSSKVIILGLFSIGTGIVFLVDFAIAFKNTQFVQTRVIG